MIANSMEELIGNTPRLALSRYQKAFGCGANLFAKLESFNPAGSVKDRAALAIVADAERKGTLKAGGTIIEPTSGNTGIGIAAVAAVRGYRALLVMPDTMSMERRSILRAYGAEIVLTPGEKGMAGAIERAEELVGALPNAILAGQFENPGNPLAHYETTGPEIWRDLKGDIACFAAGVGTGGTLTGVGRYLKEQNAGIRVVAVEPTSSPVLSEGRGGAHGIQGIGAGFVPKALDTSVYDEVIAVTDEDALLYAKRLGMTEGILCGISSGAALCAAVTLSRRAEFAGKNIVVLLPDGGDRYYSTPLFRFV